MGQPAVVAGDRIAGQCAGHQIPGPLGAPVVAPGPLPFSAPLTVGLATTVTIDGKLAAVAGSKGVNAPPHAGLHVSDPKALPPAQEAAVVTGSSSVRFDGRAAAYSGCPVTACLAPAARVTGTGSVTVGP